MTDERAYHCLECPTTFIYQRGAWMHSVRTGHPTTASPPAGNELRDDLLDLLWDGTRRDAKQAGELADAILQLLQPTGDALAKIRALCRETRQWDEADADTAEARSARAYNHALAKVAVILQTAQL